MELGVYGSVPPRPPARAARAPCAGLAPPKSVLAFGCARMGGAVTPRAQPVSDVTPALSTTTACLSRACTPGRPVCSITPPTADARRDRDLGRLGCVVLRIEAQVVLRELPRAVAMVREGVTRLHK
jgi:hypothetical protein